MTRHIQETAVDADAAAVAQAVVKLLNVAVVLQSADRQSVLKCNMCGAADDRHTASCPVPALEQWLNPLP